MGITADHHVFKNGHVVKQLYVGKYGRSPACDFMCFESFNRLVIEANRSCIGGKLPVMTLNRVVLPAPFGPINGLDDSTSDLKIKVIKGH